MHSRSIFLVISLLALTPSIAFADSATQTDWSGGPGLWGPVISWGDEFYLDDDVDWNKSPGSVVLSTMNDEHLIDDQFTHADGVYSADIDGDGDMDVLGALGNSDFISWWENTDGSGTSWIKHMIDSQYLSARSVYAQDIDGDGDMDVLGASSEANQITWWENEDGVGISWIKYTVDENFDGARCVYAEDIDNDGDYDIIGAAASGTDDITWWENIDGSGMSWTEHIVDNAFWGARSVYAKDLDQDGDFDLMGAGWHENQIAWWENTDGTGINWTKHLIDGNYNSATSVYSDDIDGDGDWDVLGSSNGNEYISWWENSDTSPGIFIVEHYVDDYVRHAYCAYSDDIDGDGDVDVVGGGQSTAWWENLDGSGTTWIKHIVDMNNDPRIVCTADINANSEVDVVIASYDEGEITWWDIEAYSPSSSLESSILNTCTEPSWNILDWDANTPSGTSVSFQVRASDNYTNMGDWSAILNEPGSLIGILSDGDMYVQYRAILATTDPDTTPSLNELYLSWSPLGVRDSPEISEYFLHGAVPNPASGFVNISIDVPVLSFVEISIYNISGHLVMSPFIGEYSQGEHELQMGELSTGIYFCRMSAENFADIKSFAVIGRR